MKEKISWKLFIVILIRMKNRGKSSLILGEDNKEVISFCQIPDYAVKLMGSNAWQPTLIVDGTFQCGSAHGVIVIASTMTGNRSVLPLAWAWGHQENNQTCTMLFQLISSIQPNISVIISDQGKAIQSSVKAIFPNAVHQIDAWHLSKTIPANARSLF